MDENFHKDKNWRYKIKCSQKISWEGGGAIFMGNN